MAKGNLGVLKVVMILNDENLNKKLKSASKEITKFEKKLKKKLRTLDKVGKSLVKVGTRLTKNFSVPLIAAIAGIALFTKKMADSADEVEKWSARSGLAIKTVQVLRFALEQAGGSFDQMEKAAIVLQKIMSESTDGITMQSRALEFLGVKTLDASGGLRKIDEVLPDLLSKLQSMEDITRRNGIAATLFGSRMVAGLIPILDQGAGSLEAMTERAVSLGLVLSDEAIRAGTQFKDLWDRIVLQLKAAATQIGLGLIPILKGTFLPLLERAIIPAILKLGELFQKLGKWFNALPPEIKLAITAFTGLLIAIGPILFIGGKLIAMVVALGKIFIPLIAILKSVGIAIGVATAPILIKIAAIAALVAIVAVVIRNYKAFGEFFVSLWIGLKAQVVGAVQSILNAIASIVAVTGLFDVIENEIRNLADGLGEIKTELDVAFDSLAVNNFGKLMGIVADNAVSDWNAVGDAIQSAVDIFRTPIEIPSLTPPGVLQQTSETLDAIPLKLEKIRAQSLITATDSVSSFASLRDSVMQANAAIESAVIRGGATLAEFGNVVKTQAKEFIRAQLFQAIAAYVRSALTTVPFPFGLIAAGIAAAGVTALFNSITPFAEGGVATQPTVALIGEAGPEVVIPLDRFEKSFGSRDTRLVNEIRMLRTDLRRKNLESNVNTFVDGHDLVRSNLRDVERSIRIIEK